MSEWPTAVSSSSAELRAEIARKEERKSTFTAQIATFGESIAALEDAAARALANGSEPDATTDSRIGSLTNHRDGLRRALNVLDADINKLRFDVKSADVREASKEADEAGAAALAAVQEADRELRKVAGKHLGAVIQALDSTFARAKQARNRREVLSGGMVTAFDADPIPAVASQEFGAALQLLERVRAFLPAA